jgi:NTP pyrophosphatase (non-canonical NTP hydrolase)
MTLNEYQQAALVTAKYPEHMKVIYPVLGLCGEAGEVAEKVKKIHRDKEGVVGELDRLEIAKELGDVLWYISTCAKDLNFTLEDIAAMNIKKLTSRKERGTISGNGDNR